MCLYPPDARPELWLEAAGELAQFVEDLSGQADPG